MLEPAELVDAARLLAREGMKWPVGEALLRRAVSTAYYALFHAVLQAAAERFVGNAGKNSGAYSILYRSFDHSHMKRACELLQISPLKERTRDLLHLNDVCQDTRDFAGSFAELQQARHTADYDPITQFARTDIASLIDMAETGIEALGRIPPQEQTAVLALLMVRARA